MVTIRSINRQMLRLRPMLSKDRGCKRKWFVPETELSVSFCVILVFSLFFHLFVCHVILLQHIMPILIISKWLEPMARDQTFWQSDKRSYIYGNTQQFFWKADSGQTTLRNRTELQFCDKETKPWLIKTEVQKVYLCLFSVGFFTWLSLWSTAKLKFLSHASFSGFVSVSRLLSTTRKF